MSKENEQGKACVMRQVISAIVVVGVLVGGARADLAVKGETSLFSLADLRVTGGKFRAIQDLDRSYLLALEPSRLLVHFYKEAGLPPKADPYPSWESRNVGENSPLSGHTLCFYLSAMAMMYASTGDGEILRRLEGVVGELEAIQLKNGDGYLMAGHDGKVREAFRAVASGDFKVGSGMIEGYFEPTYVLNKLMLGLFDVWRHCRLAKARDILVRLADWFGRDVLDGISDDTVQRLLVCEHGSFCEGFLDVYGLTGEKRYLDWARRLNHEKILAISDAPPLFGSRAEIKRRMTRKPGARLAFEYKSGELGAPVELIPFSDIHFQRAAVYFPHVRSAVR